MIPHRNLYVLNPDEDVATNQKADEHFRSHLLWLAVSTGSGTFRFLFIWILSGPTDRNTFE
jgi:hypothetical protein